MFKDNQEMGCLFLFKIILTYNIIYDLITKN